MAEAEIELTDAKLLEYKELWNLTESQMIRRGWLLQRQDGDERQRDFIDSFVLGVEYKE